MAAFVVALLVVIWIRNSQLGLRLTAIRDDENGARGLGLNPTFYKTLVFAVASALAAFAGVLWAPMVGFIGPESMGVSQSIFLLSLLIVGGTRSVKGALAGVGLLMVLPMYLDLAPAVRIALVGGALAVIALVEPKGIVGLVSRVPLPRRRTA